jgi:HEAT repeat protein
MFGKDANTPEVITLILDRTMDRDVSPRIRALQALAVVDVPKEMLSKTLQTIAARLMDDTQAGVKAQAAMTLTAFGDRATQAIPALIRGTTDPASWEIRRACIYGLGEVGRTNEGDNPDSRCVNAVLKGMSDHALQVRLESIRAMGKLGKPVDPTLQMAVEKELTRLTVDKDKVVCIWAWMSLMCVTEVNATAIQGIRSLIQDRDPRIRSAAILALSQIGSHARFAVPELAKSLKDPDMAVKSAAIVALAQIDTPGVEALTGLQAIIDEKEGNEGLKLLARSALDHIKGVKKMPDKK